MRIYTMIDFIIIHHNGFSSNIVLEGDYYNNKLKIIKKIIEMCELKDDLSFDIVESFIKSLQIIK